MDKTGKALILGLAIIVIGAVIINDRMSADQRTSKLTDAALIDSQPVNTDKWGAFYSACQANAKASVGIDNIEALNYCVCVRDGILVSYYETQGNTAMLNNLGTVNQNTAQIDADADKILGFADALSLNPDAIAALSQSCANSY